MRTSRGFSLIEVIVSIFIVGIMLLLLQAIIYSGVLVRTSKSQGIALAIARNELESLRAGGYAALPSSGSFSDSLLSSLPNATTTLIVKAYNEKTKQVTANVIWMDAGSAASSTVSLSTLITQTGGLP
ncbi:prepilin-type N-terminal cleavage/methylation domain-containing protein [Patescibacteria group bacterium]|nr:prepilin-type N-terminal cleavage/methylation domain-containing protein [Patescibacteria group bacterium]MDE2021498.1 prepilin-type N-terminal cleavage/methylation domain-containing protein [Patescibacteria group bacterium]MDE2173356.1 prepilin-type N-terminal cleavage/methylation domain-containing protein [Patescibacteria group bacterium]